MSSENREHQTSIWGIKMRKNLLLLFAASLIPLAFIGCTADPIKLQITDYDQQVLPNPYLNEVREREKSDKEGKNKFRVAVQPKVISKTNEVQQAVSEVFGKNLDVAISQLGAFEAVPRSEIASILKENELADVVGGEKHNVKIEAVDFLVIYDMVECSFKETANIFDNNKKLYKGYLKMDITLLNLHTGTKEFTRILSAESGSSEQPDISQLYKAAESVVGNFVAQFAVDFAPPAIVEMTRGSGKVALINIGKDYGVQRKSKIDFFTYREKEHKRIPVPYAYGFVIQVMENSAWVEVANFETAGVHENSFARISPDQTRSFVDTFHGILE